MWLRALCRLAGAVRYLHVVHQYARGDVPERAAEFCQALCSNLRHPAVAVVHLLATVEEISEAMAGCLQIAFDVETMLIVEGGIEAESKQMLANFDNLL